MSSLADKFDLLTLADAAELLHCSKAHICKAVRGRVRGCAAIPCVSLGRRRLIRRESLRLWLEANERVANDNARIPNDAKLTTLPVRDAGKRG
jgi:excisionase family DNA binding protein